MRTLFIPAIAIGVILSSCSSTKTASTFEDDIYYSSKDPKKPLPPTASSEKEEESRFTEGAAQSNERKESYYDDSFDYDDYYDYEYASRLRRFHNPCPGYSYYDNYYTNSYWYTSNPYHYGVSIYMGYNFWGPSYYVHNYSPGYYWGMNPYSGWSSWQNPYDPFYDPFNSYSYYGNPYGYNSYWNGYQNGYWNGYQNGYWNGMYNSMYTSAYFNTLDQNSYYYGPRKTITASNGLPVAENSRGERYIKEVGVTPVEPSRPSAAPSGKSTARPNTLRDDGTPKETPSSSWEPVRSYPKSNDANERPANGSSTYEKPAERPRSEKPAVNTSRPAEERPRNNTAPAPVQQPRNQPQAQPEQRPSVSPSQNTPRSTTPSNSPRRN